MDRRGFLVSAIALACASRSAVAQGQKAVRIGWLTAQRESSLTPYLAAFRGSLADLGYVEGRNLTIQYRFGDDAPERVPALFAELVKVPVDLIVAQGQAVSEIGQLQHPLPIVYVFSGDPVSAGLAESLARPRGNMTGLTFMAAELNGKRLDMLRDIMPDLRRVAVIANSEHPGSDLEWAYSEGVARRLGLSLEHYPTRSLKELEAALDRIGGSPPQAILLFADGFAVQNRQIIIDSATAHGIPVVSGWSVFARSGALFTYGPRLVDSYRKLASYVDRVLKGAKVADLPIEQPVTFETVINQTTAKALGLTVPPTLLVAADELIE